jgi:hypothetical protein
MREELPESITVSLDEIRAVVGGLEEVETAQQLDRLIGRMTRWVWDLLGELDDDEGYDGRRG